MAIIVVSGPFFKHDGRQNRRFVSAKCDCGTIFDVTLRESKSKISCGCSRRPRPCKHGKSKTRLYWVWSAMKSRCFRATDPNYHNYGGRGITVCDRWKNSFEAFEIDMGMPQKGMSIDRINVNGMYEPNNCRWVTMKQQHANRRDNRKLTVDGETKTLIEWSSISGVRIETLRARLNHGWTPERTVKTISK